MERGAVVDLVQGILCYRARPETARQLWTRWSESQRPLPAVFGRALLNNLSATNQGRALYVRQSDDPDTQIALFAALERASFMVASRQMANRALARCAPTTLLDLGVGHGRQFASAELPTVRRVIGVDIDPDSLRGAETRFSDSGIEFIPIASTFDALDWARIAELCGDGPLAINAAFALHHQDLGSKRRTLEQIRRLGPRVFTLVEPSSEHWPASLLHRFLHAYVHFSGVYRVLSADVVDARERDAAWRFVSREIEDVLRDVPDRYERHESWLDWYALLLDVGLAPIDLGEDLVDGGGARLTSRLPGAIDVWFEDFHQLCVFVFGTPG